MQNKRGQVDISTLLLQTITSICVSDVEGIRQIPPRLLGKVYSLFNQEQRHAAIIQIEQENIVTVDVFIAVEFNVSIPTTCETLQELIKQEIEVITGYDVKAVNIYVDAVLIK
ncbi:Asp23/Gls24 family envelope stress response protein [Sutcliffiella halmapala]|uniref:Asp23/Gls24 family envelope stress response protein n=1 Tax=Sutcliffiella halmapala TaxID=79882 RepID=UPI0009955E09|nr:Asp23/Gls24 family envelope stress response protein [Sutcliffiella halmapala]